MVSLPAESSVSFGLALGSSFECTSLSLSKGCTRNSGSDNRSLLSQSPEGYNPKIKVLAWLIVSEGCEGGFSPGLAPWLLDGCPSPCLLTWHSSCVPVTRPFINPLCKDTGHVGWGPMVITSSASTLFLEKARFWGLGVRFKLVNLETRVTIQPVTMPLSPARL